MIITREEKIQLITAALQGLTVNMGRNGYNTPISVAEGAIRIANEVEKCYLNRGADK